MQWGDIMRTLGDLQFNVEQLEYTGLLNTLGFYENLMVLSTAFPTLIMVSRSVLMISP